MKFSVENGAIQIHVNNFNSFIQISICDNGIGIAEDKKLRLKNSLSISNHWRKNSMTHRADLGMGLQISNLLALLLGHNKNSIGLIFESQKDKGTTFSFVIQNKVSNLEKEDIDNLQMKEESHLVIPRLNLNIKNRNNTHDQGLINSNDADEHKINTNKYYTRLSNEIKIPIFSTFQHLKYEATESVAPLSNQKQNNNESNQDFNHKIFFGQTDKKYSISNCKALKESGCKSSLPTKITGCSENEIQLNLQMLGYEKQNKLQNDRFKIDSPTKVSMKVRDPLLENYCKCPEILIVDDDDFNLSSMECLLKKLNYTFLSTYNGELAIAEVLKRESQPCSLYCQQFKLIFMDCSMPIMDGIQATKIIKAKIKEEVIKPTKIIAYTAFVGSNKRKECMEAGMDDFLNKPTNIYQLKKILTTYINNDTQQEICIEMNNMCKAMSYYNFAQ